MSNDEKQPSPREPWEQRDEESQQAFRAFTFYRDLGLDRSLNKAYRDSLGSATLVADKEANGTWQRWSSEYEWVERCRAYDAHCDDLRRRTRERKLIELEERRFEFETENQGLLENWVRNLDQKLWTRVEEGFTEVKEELATVDGQLVVVKRETRVKFPTMSAIARAIDTRNDTARQAVEGPRRKPDNPSPHVSPASDGVKGNSSAPNEFVWIAAPPPSDDQPSPESPTKPETPPTS